MNQTHTTRAEPTAAQSIDVVSNISHSVFLFVGILILGAAVCLVYFPATRGPFVFDDSGSIVNNLSIRQLWPLVGNDENPGPLNPPKATPVDGRPLVNMSFAVNYHFGEFDPFGYRVVHIVVHLLSAMLLWAIVARTLRLEYFQAQFDRVADPLSFAAAIVWALHPVNTECVVYVTQRTELLMGMFYLATLYCSLRYWYAAHAIGRTTWLLLAIVACFSGMLCKEMMVSAPVMVLLYDRTFVSGSLPRALTRSWRLYVGLALAWVYVLVLYSHGLRTPGAGFGQGVAAHVWWFTQAKVLFLYLKLAVWPWPLVIHYEIPYLKTAAEAWPWLLATGLLAIGTLVLLWRRSPLGFVAIWFVAVLSPTLVIPLVGETAVERRMYVPLAALVPLLVVGGYVLLRQAWRSIKPREGLESIRSGPVAVFCIVTIALAITFGYVSSHRLVAYQDELGLWQDALLYQPHDPLVQFNVGTILADAGRLSEAIPHFEQSVRLDPRSYRAHYNLARSLEASARPQEAIEHYRAALQLRTDDAVSHYNLARLLEDKGQLSEAAEHYRKTIAVQPDFSAAHTNLAILLVTDGHIQEAIKHFELALQSQEDLDNYMNVVMIYSQLNRGAKVIPVAEKALILARSQGETSLTKELETILAYFRRQQSMP
ncbi:MAG TPA: tetratricopeptide repeat protein [Pirellulaceae bacterium]|nr:tetratricopeptide repeat protein [Planctomycetales bacterium]MCB9938624.1 tetratricopeptide repeat protein [Planctomycetaceae bacterium]HRX78911.1 tetratricopeptide repeat protein [Pirellulaceae bacterium]